MDSQQVSEIIAERLGRWAQQLCDEEALPTVLIAVKANVHQAIVYAPDSVSREAIAKLLAVAQRQLVAANN